MTGSRLPNHARNHLPGGSDPIPQILPAGDAFPVNEDAGVLHTTVDGDNSHWAVIGTVDNLCLLNGYLPADGTQGAYTTFRFMLGPSGSIHEWSLLYRTGPDYGIAHFYLASIPEDDPDAGLTPDNTNVLKDISSLNFIELPTVHNAYSAVLTRNVQDFSAVGSLRLLGAPGDQFTSFDDGTPPGITIDGGPGPYAVKLQIDTKQVASTGYKFDLQALHRKRVDWAWG